VYLLVDSHRGGTIWQVESRVNAAGNDQVDMHGGAQIGHGLQDSVEAPRRVDVPEAAGDDAVPVTEYLLSPVGYLLRVGLRD
jgi:hypothetical protein